MAEKAGSLHARLSRLRDPAFMRKLVPELTIGGKISSVVPRESSARDRDEVRWLRTEGFARLSDVISARECEGIARGIEAVLAAGLPAVTVYAFDELWLLGARLAARTSEMLGARYTLMEDAWAWSIAPGRRGWPPHRGIGSTLLDRKTPQVLNVWTALVDVSSERSCMHFVPLDEDPRYPDELSRVDGSLASVRAAPLAKGNGLVWNANTLHWGGACAAHAAGPRVSCSFSLCRADYDPGLPLVDLERLNLDARIDLIATQVVTYGRDQPDVAPAIMEWARASQQLRQLTEHLQRHD